MRSGLYPFFHVALFNDFGSFVLCMSDRVFDLAHSSTASPSLSVEVYPHNVLLLLLLYALFNHPRLLIQVARVQKAQFSYRLDGLVP